MPHVSQGAAARKRFERGNSRITDFTDYMTPHRHIGHYAVDRTRGARRQLEQLAELGKRVPLGKKKKRRLTR